MYIALYLTMGLWLSLLLEVRMAERRWRRRTKEKWDIYKGEYVITRVYYSEERFPWYVWFLLAICFLGIGFLHGCYTMAMPMQKYLIWAGILRAIPLWITHELTDEKAFLQKLPKWGWKKAGIFVGIIILILIFGLSFYPRSVGYWRANEMKGVITRFEYATIEMFPEIIPEEVRVTTREIAESIAEIKRTSAASWVTSVHLGEYKGELSWICTLSEPPSFGMLVGGSNKIREIIVIPVDDPVGERAEIIPMTMMYAEGLWWQQGIAVHASDMYPFRSFTRGYVTTHGDEIVLVTTSHIEIPFTGLLIDPKIHVWNILTGNLIAEYTPQEAPEWVIQKWDESYVEIMGDAFGDYRWTSENVLNYWNGIPKHSDRSADPSEPEGLRYQRWNGELTGVYLFRNKVNPSILEFIIIVKHNELILYSVDHLRLISPDEAKAIAISGLFPLEQGEYSTPIALLYRIGDKLYYHVPIYQHYEIAGHKHYLPIYFALVNAEDRSFIREEVGKYRGALKGAIEKTHARAVKPTAEIINGTITEIYDPYIADAQTEQWLTVRTDEGEEFNVLVKFGLLTKKERFKIVSAKIGDRISIRVDKEYVVLEVL